MQSWSETLRRIAYGEPPPSGALAVVQESEEVRQAHDVWERLSGAQKLALAYVQNGRRRVTRRVTLRTLAAFRLIVWEEGGAEPKLTRQGLFVLSHRPRHV